MAVAFIVTGFLTGLVLFGAPLAVGLAMASWAVGKVVGAA